MSVLADKSYKFAIRIVKLSAYLTKEKKEYILSKQLLRSGTAIGALIAEAMSKSIFNDVEDLIKMLTSSINTTKENIHD